MMRVYYKQLANVEIPYQCHGQCTYVFGLNRRDGDRREGNKKYAEELHFSTSSFRNCVSNSREFYFLLSNKNNPRQAFR
jgi:hypothetical protein